MFGHYPLQAPEETLKKYGKDSGPERHFFCSKFYCDSIRKQTGKGHHYRSKKANGKKAFSKNFNDEGKIQKGNRWF